VPQNHTLPGSTSTVVVPAYTDIADGPKAFIDFADSLANNAGIGGTGLPTVTAADNDAVLHVAGGKWVTGPHISIHTAAPTAADGADGDIWITFKP